VVSYDRDFIEWQIEVKALLERIVELLEAIRSEVVK
jgi:hypothetical protein